MKTGPLLKDQESGESGDTHILRAATPTSNPFIFEQKLKCSAIPYITNAALCSVREQK
jgi:hypothetical protein